MVTEVYIKQKNMWRKIIDIFFIVLILITLVSTIVTTVTINKAFKNRAMPVYIVNETLDVKADLTTIMGWNIAAKEGKNNTAIICTYPVTDINNAEKVE
jgi:hypothetical protein